jgi:hypothetical protein
VSLPGSRLLWVTIGCAVLLVGIGSGVGYLAGRRSLRADHEATLPSEGDSSHGLASAASNRRELPPEVLTQKPAVAKGEDHGIVSAAEAAGAPPESPSAEAVRDLEVARLKQSGSDPRNLIADARQVTIEWSRLARAAGIEVKFSDWQCFRAGCFVNLLHAPPAIDRLTSEITKSRGFLEWNGEKMRSGPIEAAKGNVEVTWVLSAPPEGEDAIAVANERGN